jgi:hypothetical protein
MSDADHIHYIALAYLAATVILLAVVIESLWAAARMARAAKDTADEKDGGAT